MSAGESLSATHSVDDPRAAHVERITERLRGLMNQASDAPKGTVSFDFIQIVLGLLHLMGPEERNDAIAAATIYFDRLKNSQSPRISDGLGAGVPDNEGDGRLAGDTVPDSSELLKYLEESAPQLSDAEIAALDRDAVWALNAWANRRSTPEHQIHLGKYVAVFGQKVVCSGSDEPEVKARAAEKEGVSADLIYTDFWDSGELNHSML